MSTKNIHYGVRTFDLSQAREKERIELAARHISVLRADSDADIHIGTPNAAGIPAQRLENLTIPANSQRIYLSNAAASGKLILLNGLEGVEASVPTPDNNVNVTDDSTRELGKVRVQDSGGVLIDPATVALENALSSTAAADQDPFLVQEDTALDVSAAPVGVENSTGTQIDPLAAGDQPLDVSGATVPTEQQTPVGVENAAGTQVDPAQQEDYDAEYTAIDLNATGATTIYDGVTDAKIYGVHMANGGGTAEFNLEVTDGTNTAVLEQSGAGGALHFSDDIALDSGDDLQINVTAAEGSSLSETAVVFRGEL